MDAQAFGRGMIHRDEDRGLALAGHGRGQIGAPHVVDLFRADRTIVGLRPMRLADPAWRQQVVLAHQAEHAPLEVRMPAKRSRAQTFRMALAVERARCQQLADRGDQRLVRHRSD